MSKNKSKIVRWEYVTKPFDVRVNPKTVKRVHAPIEPSLETYWDGRALHLRPCVQGMDEYGVTVKYLYCTRDGRFFVRGKDGWNEVKPADNYMYRSIPQKASHNGTSGCPRMVHFNNMTCHRCVAFAWLDVPQDVKLQMIGVDALTKWEVDHLNTDHKNWTADNLQWVTTDENRRRAKIARRMRQIGLDPKLLTPTLCKGIYTLPEDMIEPFISTCSEIFGKDPSPLTAEAIRLDVAQVLDILKQ